MNIEEIVYDKITINDDVLIKLGCPQLVGFDLLRIDYENWLCFNGIGKINVIPSCKNLEEYYDKYNTYDNTMEL